MVRGQLYFLPQSGSAHLSVICGAELGGVGVSRGGEASPQTLPEHFEPSCRREHGLLPTFSPPGLFSLAAASASPSAPEQDWQWHPRHQ